MPNLTEILLVLRPILSIANIYDLSQIITTILQLSRPVTTRSIGRLGTMGLRSVERFYAQTPFDWTSVRILLFKNFFYQVKQTYLLVADETVEKKAGKCSHGLGWFYSSLAKQAIPSVSFLGLSLVSVSSRQSHFLSCTQMIKAPQEPQTKSVKQTSTAKDITEKKKRGRPKGSKNKPYTEPKSLSFQSLKQAVGLLLELLDKYCPGLIVAYLVLDGFYGNQHYVKYALSTSLKMISKLRHNAHLILPYTGEQKPNGRPKKYGERLDYKQMPQEAAVSLPKDHQLNQAHIKVWALKVYAPSIKDCMLKVVIIQRISPNTKKIGQTILFTNDLDLEALEIIDYYSLRFQIEFDFRDAKQFFGLSDFKNYKQNQLTNAVNIAFTSKLISQILLEKYKKTLNKENLSITDLKAILKAKMYYAYFLNTSENSPDDFLNEDNFLNFVKLEAINL